MRMTCSIFSRTSLAVFLWLGTASADAADNRLRIAFEAAQKAYTLGQFEQALKGYTEVFDAKPRPELLFNIAQCHRQIGNHERAVFFYQRYLTLSPTPPKNAARVQELIAESKRKMAEEEALRVAVAEPPRAPEPPAALVAPPQPESFSAAPERTGPWEDFRSTPRPITHEVKEGSRWWLWAGAGVLVAGAGAAAGYMLLRPGAARPTLGEIQVP